MSLDDSQLIASQSACMQVARTTNQVIYNPASITWTIDLDATQQGCNPACVVEFVWTGDGKPDKLTAQYAKGVNVFVPEMPVDNVSLWALKQGVSLFIGAFTLDNFHTTHYAAGYLANLIQPRLAMATHVSFTVCAWQCW